MLPFYTSDSNVCICAHVDAHCTALHHMRYWLDRSLFLTTYYNCDHDMERCYEKKLSICVQHDSPSENRTRLESINGISKRKLHVHLGRFPANRLDNYKRCLSVCVWCILKSEWKSDTSEDETRGRSCFCLGLEDRIDSTPRRKNLSF